MNQERKKVISREDRETGEIVLLDLIQAAGTLTLPQMGQLNKGYRIYTKFSIWEAVRSPVTGRIEG